MGRNPHKELVRIVGAITEYLDRAAGDATLGLSYEAIEKGTGVSRGHLSRRKEPEIVDLVSRIASLKAERLDASEMAASASDRPGASPSRPVPLAGALPSLSDEALQNAIARDLRELTRLQQQWVSRHARADVRDAPLALYDADALLPQLRAAVERVRPLITESTRRAGIASVVALPTTRDGGMPSLF